MRVTSYFYSRRYLALLAPSLTIQFHLAYTQEENYYKPDHPKITRYVDMPSGYSISAMSLRLPWQFQSAHNTGSSTQVLSNTILMDNLTYFYAPGTDRLMKVIDDVNASAFDTDFDGEHLYFNDENGALIKETGPDGTIDYTLNASGKVSQVVKGTMTIDYLYDAQGNREKKTVSINGNVISATLYVQSPAGPVIYEKKNGGNEFKLTEVPITGGLTRAGMWQRADIISELSPAGEAVVSQRKIGDKHYELSDHLGSPSVIVSDAGEVESYTSNFPFGMRRPGQNYAGAYRYGFNGYEQDNEIKGEAASLDGGARFEDPLIARFTTLDPMRLKYAGMSPYVFAADNPIFFVDGNGMAPNSFPDPNPHVGIGTWLLGKISAANAHWRKVYAKEGPWGVVRGIVPGAQTLSDLDDCKNLALEKAKQHVALGREPEEGELGYITQEQANSCMEGPFFDVIAASAPIPVAKVPGGGTVVKSEAAVIQGASAIPIPIPFGQAAAGNFAMSSSSGSGDDDRDPEPMVLPSKRGEELRAEYKKMYRLLEKSVEDAGKEIEVVRKEFKVGKINAPTMNAKLDKIRQAYAPWNDFLIAQEKRIVDELKALNERIPSLEELRK